MTRGPLLVLGGAVVLLAAILALAVSATVADPGPGGGAAQLVPASALAFARLSTDPDDPAARRLAQLAPRIPGYLRLRDAALTAVSPAPGAFDLRRDVRPWLGDEAAVALVDLGGGRFGSLAIARVRNRPRAEALLQRIAGSRPGVRYGETVVRRFGGNAAAFVRGFLVAGPELAVQRSIDVARGDAPSLARSRAFQRALEGSRRPAEVYVSPRGLRARGGLARVLDHPRLRALGAAAGADGRAPTPIRSTSRRASSPAMRSRATPPCSPPARRRSRRSSTAAARASSPRAASAPPCPRCRRKSSR